MKMPFFTLNFKIPKIKYLLTLMVFTAISIASADAQNVIRYVKPAAAGLGDGTSWANASGDLQAMIDGQGVTEVWVAAGTYKPVRPADNISINNRDKAFVMKSNVKIYGGFPATGSPQMSDRNLETYTSLLSGDLDNNDTISIKDAYHVLIAAGNVGSAILEGFTISGGYAYVFDKTSADTLSDRSLLVNGKAILTNQGGGVAIFDASPVLRYIKVIGNSALLGGGISLTSSSAIISFSEISGNNAPQGGGGVANLQSSPSFSYSTISGNTSAGKGGGVFNSSSAPVFVNALIIGNYTVNRGGGMYNESGSNPVLTNLTISGNNAGGGAGGIYNVDTSSPVIRNSAITANNSGITTTATLNYANSLIQGLTTSDNGNIPDSDPYFKGAPAYSTAPFRTGNYQMERCSPLINKGDNSVVSFITTDFAGNPRIHHWTVDIGGLEYQGNLLTAEIRYVKAVASGTGDGSSWANASADLQQMINTICVEEVWVAAGTYKPIHPANNISATDVGNRDNAFVMKVNVKVYGGFPATGSPLMTDRDPGTFVSILSGDLDNNGAINDNDAHHVVIAAGDLETALLDGFTISGGNATDNIPNRTILVNNKGILSNRAGGINIFESSPELSHIKVNGNKAVNGGGINIINAAPSISFVEISGNQSTAGGGGVGTESSNPSFLNTTISNNTSNYGGGINNYQGAPSFVNTLITGNHAAIHGGAIYNRSGLNPILTNVTISGNAAPEGGGAIYNVETASPIIRNSVISGNSSGIFTTGSLNCSNSMIQGLSSSANGNVADSDPLFQGALSYVSAPFSAGNYWLEPCSPLLNKGDNTQLSGIMTDLAGNPRIYNTTVDIGAFEYQGNFSLTEKRFVKPVASGTGDGTSWQNASDDIQLMINAPCVQEIWVAKGRYKPKRRADNLSEINDINSNNAFVLKKDLKLYGGFNGTETALSERVLSLAGRSVLSGDLDDSNTQTNADAYHVVISLGDAGSGTLDGFIITQGKAGHGNNPMTVKGEVILSDRGAGIYISRSSPLIANISVVENVSIAGGAGIYNSESSPEINNCLISSNFATGSNSNGGGVLNTNSSSPRIIATIISGNGTGDVGGGISNVFSSSPAIINSLITGNRAGGTRGGGAMSIEVNSSPNLINTTISGNASSGGTIYSNYAYTVRNSIIWGNQTGLSGTEPTYSNSLIQGKTSVTQGNIEGTSNPLFRNALGFASAPSAVGDFRLWVESPVINKGDNSAISGIATDLDGTSRIFGDVIDIGAYENRGGQFPILYVKEGGTGGGTSWQDANGDIQSALNAPQPHEVWVAGGTYKPLRSAEDPATVTPGDRKNAFVIRKDIKLYGGFAGTETTISERNLNLTANRSVLSGDLDNTNTLTDGDAIHTVISTGDVGTAIIDGFTITGGNANVDGLGIFVNGVYIEQLNGGGFYNQSNLSLLKNVIVRGNSAAQYGGGIYNNTTANTAFVITNSVLSGNTSVLYGGGIYNLSSSLTIINTVVSGNQAVLGGGLCNSASSPKIVNTTITANKSTNSGAGGAIFNFGDAASSSPVIQNTIIWGNSGGVFQGSPVFTHSFVQGSMSATDGNIPDNDPQFVAGISFGTAPNSAGDFRIAACSPLVDKGSNTFLGEILTDLNGNNRFSNTTTDIGAYENQGEGSVTVRYVKPLASGTGDGTSWANASGDLQAMIQAPCVQQVWMAGGVYKPVRRADVPEKVTPGDRNNAFVMRKNVKIYGGFAGTESALSERNLTISANLTVLNGDLNSNSTVDDADAYHVVVASGELGNALMDGLTISGGNANGPIGGQISVKGNTVYQFYGGGLYGIGASVSLNAVFILGNRTSNDGGGIFSDELALNITNAVIAGNRADGSGGGVYNRLGSSTFTNVTISGNQGGAISNSNATATIANSVVYGNSNGLTDEGFSISYSMIQGSSSTANHNIADTSPRFANAPLFGNAPFTNGDYRLLSCSPLVNKGDNALLTSVTADIVGNPRIYGITTDIGAFELQLDGSTASGIRYVKAGMLTGTKDGSSWENASDDLQAMLNDLCASEVWVAGGLYKPVRRANDLWTINPGNRINAFVLTSNVKLYGGFAGTEITVSQRNLAIVANKSVLSGDLDGSNSLNDNDSYHVVISAGDVGSAVIDGFTITGGHANASGQSVVVNNRTISGLNGAGIALYFSSPAISNVIVTGNTAVTTDLGSGGGILINNSSPIVKNSTISNNVARSGAGIFSTGNTSSPQFFNCKISGNVGKGSESYGGGIVSVYNIGLVNCQITGNTAESDGAGVVIAQQSKLVAINTVISGNKSVSGAGSFSIYGNASIQFVNSIVWGNSGSPGGTNYTCRNSLIQGLTSSENGNIPDTNPQFNAPLDFSNAPSVSGDFSPQNCSPLINAGTTDTTGLYLLLTDLAGNARIAFDRIDMGSFENSHTPVSSIASNSSVVINMQKSDGATQYYNHCNELVATLNGTNDAASVSGSTVAKVWIEANQSTAYVKRHYEITPSNPEGSGIVKLYFTNQEFKDFNAAGPASLLPDADQSESMVSRASNVILEKLTGTSNNGTGLPASYTAGTSNITPSSVFWNSSLGRWEITFSTTGFSGFFVKTNTTPLPVSWISFTGTLNKENQPVLNWKVNETQVKSYEIQRSQNATNFETVGTVDAKGNGMNTYQFTDIIPLVSNTYYRIKQTDFDGSSSHSRIINIMTKSLFSFYPNPVTDVVTITVDKDQVGTKVTVIAADGKVVKQQTIRSQSFSMDVTSLPKGIYLIRTQNGRVAKLIRE